MCTYFEESVICVLGGVLKNALLEAHASRKAGTAVSL